MPVSPGEAMTKLEEYRQKYEKRESIEEQFLLKAEVILMLSGNLEKHTAWIALSQQDFILCHISNKHNVSNWLHFVN